MSSSRGTWIVVWDAEAVVDFEDVKSRQERKAAFNAGRKLKALGPELQPPHMKPLQGEADLLELRPRQGDSPVRLIYARIGSRLIILSLARDKSAFNRAVSDARDRLSQYKGLATRK